MRRQVSESNGKSMNHLLDPIRELSVELDLAGELEEYLQVINFDESLLVNFAQAALLVQQSSALYSKKVEHLYTLVLESLANLQSNDIRDAIPTTAKAVKKSKTNQGKAATRKVVDTTLTIADMAAEVNQINWIVRTNVEESKKIDLPPTQRTAKANSDIKKTTSETFQASMVLMGSFVSMDNDSGESLKLKSCMIDPKTGAMFLDDNSKILLQSITDQPFASNTNSEEPNQQFGSDLGPAITELPVITEEATYSNDDGVEYNGGNDDYDNYEPLPDFEKEPEVPSKVFQQQSPWSNIPAFPSKEVVTKDTDDPWALLDAYETTNCVIKPFRKGITYRTRLPKPPKTIIKEEPIYTPEVKPKHYERLRQHLLKRPFKLFTNVPEKHPIRVEYAKCFAKIREEKISSDRNQSTSKDTKTTQPIEPNEENDYEYDDGVDYDDASDDNDWDDESALNEVPTVKKISQDDAMKLNEFEMSSISRSLDWDDSTPSYEELCKQQIEQFMQGTENFLKETTLSKHVNDWQMKLAPILIAQDARPPFDVKECGHEIVEKLSDTKDNVAFDAIVQDMADFEICRVFSALLHLANDGDVELDHDISMDTLRLTRKC